MDESKETLISNEDKFDQTSSSETFQSHEALKPSMESSEVREILHPSESKLSGMSEPSLNLSKLSLQNSDSEVNDEKFKEASSSEITPFLSSPLKPYSEPSKTSPTSNAVDDSNSSNELQNFQVIDLSSPNKEDKEDKEEEGELKKKIENEISDKKEQDIETGYEFDPCCRICLENDDDDVLISPCQCKGSQKYVHRKCLNHWRSVKDGFAFLHCTTCKAAFHIKLLSQKDEKWRKFKFYFRIYLFEACIIISLIQLIILLLATLIVLLSSQPFLIDDYFECFALLLVIIGIVGTLFHCSQNAQTEPLGQWIWFPALDFCGLGLLIIAVIFFAFLGVSYGIIASFAVVQRVCKRHYDVFFKKVLAEVFELEDVMGNYSSPNLDYEIRDRLLKFVTILHLKPFYLH